LQKKYQYIRGGNGPAGQKHHRDFSLGGSRVGSGNIEAEKSQDTNGASSEEVVPAQSSQVILKNKEIM